MTPFNITTPDGETLYSWHILPLGVYAKHEAEILAQPDGPPGDFTRTLASKLLTQDPEARVVINCKSAQLTKELSFSLPVPY